MPSPNMKTEPRNRFPAWRAGTTTLFDVRYRPARLYCGIDSLDSIPRLLKRLRIRALHLKVFAKPEKRKVDEQITNPIRILQSKVTIAGINIFISCRVQSFMFSQRVSTYYILSVSSVIVPKLFKCYLCRIFQQLSFYELLILNISTDT